jgi:hypothetical protein
MLHWLGISADVGPMSFAWETSLSWESQSSAGPSSSNADADPDELTPGESAIELFNYITDLKLSGVLESKCLLQ